MLLQCYKFKLEERSDTESRRFCLKPQVEAVSDENTALGKNNPFA